MIRTTEIHKDRTLFWKARERSISRRKQSSLSKSAKRSNKRKTGMKPLDLAPRMLPETSARQLRWEATRGGQMEAGPGEAEIVSPGFLR